MAVLGWETPPANAVDAGQKHTKWAAVADLLKTRPKEWAKVSIKLSRQQAVTLTNSIALARRPEFTPPGSFVAQYAEGAEDARTVEGKDGQTREVFPVAVYAMYVGEDGQAPEFVDPDDDPDDPGDPDDE